jgi:hypothetical protein
MEYNKNLLETWCKMKHWGDYLIQNGGLTASKEGFIFLSKEYYDEVHRRINCVKKLLKKHEDSFLNYTLAELYDRCNEDESPTFLFKWPVRYYCLRALEFDTDFIPARELLHDVDDWLDFISDK